MKEILKKIIEKQQKKSFYVSIEETDTKGQVKVIPRNKEGCCDCDCGFMVSVDSFQEIEDTGKTICCCDKELALLKVVFKKDASMSLEEVFSKAMKISAEIEAHKKKMHYCGDPCYVCHKHYYPCEKGTQYAMGKHEPCDGYCTF